MRKILALFVIAFTSVITSVCGQFTNVIVDNNFGPQEPSITINAVNVSQMVAGSNTNNSYYSVDGGATWITTFINSSLGSTGDPCLVSDSLGNIFYFHLSDMYDRIVCQKSINGGLNYNDGFFTWNNNSQLQDKEWATVDRHSNNIYVTWTQYDGGFNPGPQDSSRIYFAKSEDNGTTFSDGVRINKIAGDCLYLDITDAHPVAGPNGEIYVTFMDSMGIRFNKSIDSGSTWLSSQPLIDSGGAFRYYSIPGVSRIRSMPYSACDNSNSPYRGNVYVSWVDQRNGVNNTDIFFSMSADGGNLWSSAMKVNGDNTTSHQFRNAMTVDQVTGNIYIVYYDRRNYSNDSTDVYLSKSVDGGTSWTDYKISSTGFENPGSDFDGDYIDIAAHDGVVRPIWTRVDNFITSIWTCLFNELSAGIADTKSNTGMFTINPNPADIVAAISFSNEIARGEGVISDVTGRVVKKFTVDHQREKVIDLTGIPSGIYYVIVIGRTGKLIVGK